MAQQSSFRGMWALPILSVHLMLLLQLAPKSLANVETLNHRLFCHLLPTDLCAFAVDSSGRRCVLETVASDLGGHVCQTSPITVGEDVLTEYIETDQCFKICGVSKITVGLSTDLLMSLATTEKICSSKCYEYCPNIIDLYSSLAQGEGSSLRQICLHHAKQRLALYEETVNVDGLGLSASAPAPAPSSST